MQRIPIDEIVFCRSHKQFQLMQRSPIEIAVTRADFTRTRVIDPSVTRESNSISTKFLLSAPKEVFTSKNIINHLKNEYCMEPVAHEAMCCGQKASC